MSSKWQYKVTQPDLPPGAKSPMMSDDQMTTWLNEMASRGWEFVGIGQKHWNSGLVQTHWVFRRHAT